MVLTSSPSHPFFGCHHRQDAGLDAPLLWLSMSVVILWWFALNCLFLLIFTNPKTLSHQRAVVCYHKAKLWFILLSKTHIIVLPLSGTNVGRSFTLNSETVQVNCKCGSRNEWPMGNDSFLQTVLYWVPEIQPNLAGQTVLIPSLRGNHKRGN